MSQDRSEAFLVSLLKALEIPEAGRGFLVIHDGDLVIALALSFILSKAKSRLCIWHHLHNIFLKAKGLSPDNRSKVKGIIKVAKQILEISEL